VGEDDPAGGAAEREEPSYVPLTELADLNRAIRSAERDGLPIGDARRRYAGARAAWISGNAPIAEEFYGESLPRLAALLTAGGNLHLLYRAGEIAEVEPGFAEALMSLEFLDSQATVLLGPGWTKGTAPAVNRGRALIGTTLYSVARYALDFVDYANAQKDAEDIARANAASMRDEFGIEDPHGDKNSKPSAAAGPASSPEEYERERARRKAAEQAGVAALRQDEKAAALKAERERLTSAALTVVSTRLEEARATLLRQARAQSTRLYIYGVGAGLVVMVGVALVVGLVLGRTNEHIQELGLAIGAGGVGAFISVLTRLVNSSLKIDLNVSRVEVLMAGASRVFIGAVFGAVVVVFGVSKLISLPTGDPNAENFLWAALGFLAGFSERWVQDLLGTVESTSKK
jgi:hypothetical protein